MPAFTCVIRLFVCCAYASRAQICYNLCIDTDPDYEYFGLQYSFECWCSKSFDPEEEAPAPAADCTMPCSKNEGDDCGGFDRMFAYKINE